MTLPKHFEANNFINRRKCLNVFQLYSEKKYMATFFLITTEAEYFILIKFLFTNFGLPWCNCDVFVRCTVTIVGINTGKERHCSSLFLHLYPKHVCLLPSRATLHSVYPKITNWLIFYCVKRLSLPIELPQVYCCIVWWLMFTRHSWRPKTLIGNKNIYLNVYV